MSRIVPMLEVDMIAFPYPVLLFDASYLVQLPKIPGESKKR